MAYSNDVLAFIQRHSIKVIEKESHQMNPMAGREFGFHTPKDTVFIDKNLSEDEKDRTLRHELREMHMMKQGMKYWDAHKIAQEKEHIKIR
jgi:hypothetical protein